MSDTNKTNKHTNATNNSRNSYEKLDYSHRSVGYIALSSVLVISAVVVVIGITVSALSISEAQMSLASKKGHESLQLVDSCVEEALLYLNERNILPPTVTLPEGNCTISLNSQSGNQWVFTTSGIFEGYAKKIQVTALRDEHVVITGWKEVD